MYIEEVGNTNYANQISKTMLSNTGANGDEVCKINDMALNIFEWTTEYSPYTVNGEAKPCNRRGGTFDGVGSTFTAYRDVIQTIHGVANQGFRFIIY